MRWQFDSKLSAFVVEFQLHDPNVHWLELTMVAEEEYISKAWLEELVENAAQLQDLNTHWLELVTVADEESM